MDVLLRSGNIAVRRMNRGDIPLVCKADGDESEKNKVYLSNQLANQEKQECCAFLALYEGEIAGYVFLYYRCKWGGLGNSNIPGIVDLIVFEKYRKRGVATALLDTAEKIAKAYGDKVYLDVCLGSKYGPAQRLYAKRGFIPDGRGVYYNGTVCEANAICRNDEELTLCLIKEI